MDRTIIDFLNEIPRDERLSHAEVRLILALALRANHENFVWRKLDILQKETNISRPWIVKLLKNLEQKGWVNRYIVKRGDPLPNWKPAKRDHVIYKLTPVHDLIFARKNRKSSRRQQKVTRKHNLPPPVFRLTELTNTG